MKLNPILLCLLLTLFCQKVEGSKVATLRGEMEDLRANPSSVLAGFKAIDAKRKKDAQKLPTKLTSGRALLVTTEDTVIKQQAQIRRAEVAGATTPLTEHEKAVLKGVFGDSVNLETFSPELVRSCGFGDNVADSGMAKKYQELGHSVLYSSIINTALLERLALELFKTTEKDELDDAATWHELKDLKGAIVKSGNGSVRYSVSQKSEFVDGKDRPKISDRKVRFYFFNNDWDNPSTALTESANLVLAQVNIDIESGGLSYDTTVKGRFLQGTTDKERKKLASKAYWLAADQYREALLKSSPKGNETNKVLISILRSNMVDMAASGAKMYRYAAALAEDEAKARRHLKISDRLLKAAAKNLGAVQDYQAHVLAAHKRLLTFATDKEASEEQFVEDFRFVVGKSPQFVLDRHEVELLEDDSSSEEDSKSSSVVDLKMFPSLRTWNTLMEARKEGATLEYDEYFEMLRGALNIDPSHLFMEFKTPESLKPHTIESMMKLMKVKDSNKLEPELIDLIMKKEGAEYSKAEAKKRKRKVPLYVQRHMDYYNFDALTKMIADQKEQNKSIRLELG